MGIHWVGRCDIDSTELTIAFPNWEYTDEHPHGESGGIAVAVGVGPASSDRGAVVGPPVRIELTTYRLQGGCSTTELQRLA